MMDKRGYDIRGGMNDYTMDKRGYDSRGEMSDDTIDKRGMITEENE